jgi:hypothetical protein
MVTKQEDYYVVTREIDDHPHPWRWEMRRHSRPMGVKLTNGGYRSQLAAEYAGKQALMKFLEALAEEERRR